MKQEEFCPHCKESLQGDPIPKENQYLYGGATHFSLKLGIYDEGLDRTVEYACPFCEKQWSREDVTLKKVEEKYVSQTVLDEKELQFKQVLKEKDVIIQSLLGQVNKLSSELDNYEDMITPFTMFSQEGLELVGEVLKKGNEGSSTEERVTHALGQFLVKLANFNKGEQ